MSNTFAPFGFRPVSTSNGPVNWRVSTRRILSTNNSPIFKGDVVMPVTGTANGYITVGLPGTIDGTHPIAGIFWGCQYLSTTQKRVVWSQYWPGSDATGDVIAYVIDDPNARFVVQAFGSSFVITGTNTAFGSSPVGQYAQFGNNLITNGVDTGSPPNGSTTTQQSGMYLTAPGSTAASNPFIVTDMVIDPPGANGTDATSANNYVVVGFNNEWLRGNVAVTGIS